LLTKESDGTKPSFRRVLANRSMFFLWMASSVSQSGDYVFNVALVWYVLSTTHSVFLVGITEAVVNIPPALVAPIAGVYADRYNRRNVLIYSAVAQGIITAIIGAEYITKQLNFTGLMFLVFFLFAFAQFFIAAVNAYIPRTVEKQDLASANSLFSVSSMSNQLIGYGAGGILVLAVGVFVPIVYDSFTFFAAATLLLFVSSSAGVILRPRLAKNNEPIQDEQSADTQEKRNFIRDFKEGIAYFNSDKSLHSLVLVGFVLLFFSGGLIALLAPYAKLELHGSSEIYAALLVAAVIGGAVGAFIFGKMDSRKHVGKIFATCVFTSGIAVVMMGAVPRLVVAFPAGILLGGSYFVAYLAVTVIVQARIPSRLVARVYTVFFGIIETAPPIASFLSGWFANYIPVALIYLIYGICVLAMGLLIFVFFRDILRVKY
jgi:MFS transporter, DHA3 family, macrolide efflux protein